VPEQAARILVVDDNEMNRDMLSRRLQRRGFDTAIAINGRDALNVLEAEPFDLVLLDIMMPEMDGYEVLQHLKASEALRHLPVIMISARDDIESVVRCIELGAEDHLPKPFNATLLGARIGASLEKKRLRDRERLYAKALQRELDIGREIQTGFLPEVLPEIEGWEIAATFQPATQVAGDFYDAFLLPDRRHAGLVIADVCGKGVGAALFMALFRSLIRMGMTQAFASGADDLHTKVADLAASVNNYIARTHERANMFATSFIGILDTTTGTLVYTNAGHDPPMIIAPGAPGPVRLATSGPALGLMPDLHFSTAELVLAPGEALFCFTDGVCDARDPDGIGFSEENIVQHVVDPVHNARELLERIETAVLTHRRGADPFDDITMLAVRRKTV